VKSFDDQIDLANAKFLVMVAQGMTTTLLSIEPIGGGVVKIEIAVWETR